MNRQTLKLALLAMLLSLAVGMLMPRLMKGEWRELFTEKEPDITLPDGELKTDSFSVCLLQTALQTPEYPMDTVCPAAMTEALYLLNAMSENVTRAQIEALKICPTAPELPTSTVLAAIEETLPRPEQKQAILLLPFRSNYPEAISTFNTLFGCTAADSGNSSQDTRLFMALRTNVDLSFRQRFYQEDATYGDFDNADGGMPSVYLMRRCGKFRIAEAEDGSWQAIALLLEGAADDAAFVAVLPQGNVRDFALQLPPEQLSQIRRALAEATPQECTVEIPRLDIAIGLRNIAPLWQTMGLSAPFDIRTADFSRITTDKLALNTVAEHLSCRMQESGLRPADIPAADSCPQHFSLTKPFLWFVGDLTTDAPFVAIGIVENL